MLPQLGAGGCWPRPRNDRLASAMTAAAIASVAWTISAGAALGSTWTSATRHGRLPMARAARMKSSALIAIACPRVSRTKTGVAETPMAIIALARLGPRHAARAIA